MGRGRWLLYSVGYQTKGTIIMAQQTTDQLPQFELVTLDEEESRITKIVQAGEQIFKEIQKATGKSESEEPTGGNDQSSKGNAAFKFPQQAKNAFNTVASYVGWGGAAVGTVLLIRKILK